MKINWNQFKPHFPIVAITILATILRFVTLYRYGDFWDDEMFNFIYSQKAWPHGLIYWLWETNPPLHLLILKIWLYIFPATEFFTRLPSVIAGIASVIAINKLGKTLFNKNTGLIAAIYLAIHPYHIYWSATARIYVFLMLFVTLSTYFFYQRFFSDDTDKQKNNRTYWLSMPTNFLLIFSHLTSLFFLAGQFIILITLKGKAETSRWVKENLVPFSVGGLWIAASFWIKIGNHLEQSWFLNIKYSLNNIISPLLNLLVGKYSLILGVPLILIAITTSSCVFYNELKQKNYQLLFLTILTIIPLLLSIVFNVWHIKFFMCILPLFILIVAYSFIIMFGKPKFAISIIILICSTGLINIWQSLPTTDWHSVELFVKEKPANTIFVYNYHILKNQIERYSPYLTKRAVSFIPYNNMDWDDLIVKKNYLLKCTNDTEKNTWYANNKIDNFTSLVLLQNEYYCTNNLDQTLINHGWKLAEKPKKATISENYNLYWYEKN